MRFLRFLVSYAGATYDLGYALGSQSDIHIVGVWVGLVFFVLGIVIPMAIVVQVLAVLFAL